MIVQDARKSPTSGKIVTSLGSYNPHTKSLVIDKEKAGLFLKNGAQPSSRVVSLLAKDGVTIPEWAQKLAKKERAIKNTDKLRKNRPAGEPAPVAEPVEAADAPVEEAATPEAPATEAAPETVETTEAPADDAAPAEASDEVAQSSTESEDSSAAEVVPAVEPEEPVTEEPTAETEV